MTTDSSYEDGAEIVKTELTGYEHSRKIVLRCFETILGAACRKTAKLSGRLDIESTFVSFVSAYLNREGGKTDQAQRPQRTTFLDSIQTLFP